MRVYRGFAIAQIMVILLVSSILIIAAMPMMTVKRKMAGGNNADVIKCIVTESATNLSSSVCSTAISGALKERDNSFNTILSYVDSSNTTQSGAAKKVLREVCRQGGENACKYFMNQCLLSNAECNNASSDYDMHYFLTLAYSDSAANKMFELIDKHYKLSEANILSSLNNACTLSNNSASCKFLMDKCNGMDSTACSYFVNRCKDNAACNIASSNYDLDYLLAYAPNRLPAKDILVKLVTPYYLDGNTNMVKGVDDTCVVHPGSIACSIYSLDEKKCVEGNDDLACSALATECVNGNIRKCNDIVTACNNGKTNACKYGYLNDINRSCFQIKNRTKTLYTSDNRYISLDSSGTRRSVYCSGDWTRLYIWYDTTVWSNAEQNAWGITTPTDNKVRNDYIDNLGISRTNYHRLVGGPNLVSGVGYSPTMYLERVFDYLNVPHTDALYEFYVWYCGPWSGENYSVYYDDVLKISPSAFTMPAVTSWKTWDNVNNCYPVSKSFTAVSSVNTGKIHLESNLSSAPSEKSVGISYLRVYVK